MTVAQAQLIVIAAFLGLILGVLFFMSTQLTDFETRVISTLDRIGAIEQGLQVK